MAAAWGPQQQGLEELLSCLRNSSASSTAVQEQVQKRLESFNEIPDYNCYLTYILTQCPAEEQTTRSMAGLLLKNNIRLRVESFSPDVVNYVKANIFRSIGDSVAMIRSTVSTVIDTLVVSLGPDSWPEALSQLMELADSQDKLAQEGAFSTLDKLCQDIPKKLELMQVNGTHPLDFMIPKFIAHIDSPSPKIRVHALDCVLQFISPEVNPLTHHLESFMVALFKHASDDSSDVRKLVCQALVQLLATRPDVLIPHMPNVVEFMLYSTQDKVDDEVALEACEFWLTFAEDPDLVTHFRPYLPKVVPVLLDGMVYSEDDIIILDTDDDDAAVPDKASDIKPHLLSSKAHTNEREEDPNNPNGAAKVRTGEDDDEEEDDEDEYDDEDDEDAYTEWNLRKCSAAAMDVIAVTFESELLEVLLPHLKEKLFSSEWPDRESAILALGAIAEGCIAGIEQHLPILLNFLFNSLSDPKPLVRSIACWTIGRYASWTVKDGATPEHKQTYFVPAMEGLLKCCLDNNKRVQEAGCSAFATLEEEAGNELDPFLSSILGNLVFAFNKYQQKNLLILYDAIGTLADAVGGSLNNDAYTSVLMPPLIQRWQALQDSDPDLIPLLECLSSVVIAIGQGFVGYAQPVFERCVRIVRQCLVEYQNYTANPIQYDEPDKTFLIVSLDLLSGLTQGLNTTVIQLYQSSDPPVLTLLAMCLQHPDPAVRQSSYALMGDTAISCFPLLKPVLSQFMPGLVNAIEVEPRAAEISVCNNAAWAAGEIALQAGPDMEQWVQPLMERIVPVLLSTKAARSLTENSAVTIGRMAIVCPSIVAPHLQVFISSWCQALSDIKDNEEKDSAFRGICQAIQINPNGVAASFGYFLNAVARWRSPSPQLDEMFKNILVAFKSMTDDAAWEGQLQHMPATVVTRLRERRRLKDFAFSTSLCVPARSFDISTSFNSPILDAYLKSTKASEAGPSSSEDVKGKGRAKPYERARYGDESLKPINGGIKLANKRILSRLGQDDNLITNSLASKNAGHVVSCSSGHQTGHNALSSVSTSWRLHRNAKLKLQAPKKEKEILKGVVAYLNGYMGKEITNLELIGLIQKNGGSTRMNLSASCTHVLTSQGLSGSKTEKFLTRSSNSTKVVRPEWVLECIRNGKRISESKFGIVFHEAQKSVLEIMDDEDRDGKKGVRKKHAADYECSQDIPKYSPKKVKAKAKEKEREEIEEILVLDSSSPLRPAEEDDEKFGVGKRGGAVEEDEEEEEEEEELDEWGMPPSAQRR